MSRTFPTSKKKEREQRKAERREQKRAEKLARKNARMQDGSAATPNQ